VKHSQFAKLAFAVFPAYILWKIRADKENKLLLMPDYTLGSVAVDGAVERTRLVDHSSESM
jgi:hypothetical protein